MKTYKTLKGLYNGWECGTITNDEMQMQLLKLYINNDKMVNTIENFKMFDAVDKTLFIDENDIAEFNKLPDTVKLYRGQNTEDLDGISWTTDYNIALQFAYRHKMLIRDIEVGVLMVEVNKTDIKAYTNKRNEKECIITDSSNSEWVLY